MIRVGRYQNQLTAALISLVTVACTHASPTSKRNKKSAGEPEPVAATSQTSPAAVSPPTVAVAAPTPMPSATPAPTPLADCKPVQGFPGDEPVFVKSADVVLTRIAGACDLADGSKGHLPSGGWMAMGFPCTGGEGRIDWKGTNYNLPKMVSFLLDTSCPMAPTDLNRLKTLVTTEIGISPQAPLVAFNPFVVQYWEVQGSDDADASFAVDLRTAKSLSGIWAKEFIKQKPIRVLLVGRENAWVPGNNIYAVNAELNWASKNRFTMKVSNAHVLKGDELNAVKTRCEALRPERECGKVF